MNTGDKVDMDQLTKATFFAVKSSKKVSTTNFDLKKTLLDKKTKQTKKTGQTKMKPTGKIIFDSDTEEEHESTSVSKVSTSKISPISYNKSLIDSFSELESIMMAKGEPFRARAYKKAKESIMSHTSPIRTEKDIASLPGVGKTIVTKAKELIETGTIKALERERTNPLLTLTQVYGIGSKKAESLIKDHDITTVAELRESLQENPKLLNDKQKIGVQYYDDIIQRIPRGEIKMYRKLFKKAFQASKTKTGLSKATFEIVGSYRRGAKTSGDIDIIITEPGNNEKIYTTFMDELESLGIILEFLSRGPKKSMVIGRLDKDHTARRIDFMFSPPEEYPFAILYFTGSAAFNTAMRHRANEMQYTMNEHGLYKFIKGKKGQQLDLFFEKEEDIFQFLSIKYIQPEERIDGTSMIIIPEETKEEVMAIKKPKPKTTEKVISKKSTLISPKVENEKVKTSTTIKTLKHKTRSSSLKKTRVQKTLDTDASVLTTGRLSIDKHMERFIHEGIDYLYSLGENTLAKMIRIANDAYYNKSSILTDGQFDILKDYMETKYPDNKVLKEVGAPIEKNKVKLPYFMGSMDKIKPDTAALSKWMKKYKGPFVLSAKLDGISALYTYLDGDQKLYTRGNGEYGQDITYLIPYLNLPEPKDQNIVLRGEIIMKKEVFNNYFKDEAANARNLVSGIVNSKTSGRDKYKYLDFVAYEVIEPVLKPSEQLNLLTTLSNDMSDQSLQVVVYNIQDVVNNELLSEYLVNWRDSYQYEIDGVIVTNDVVVKRKKGNPEHAFAFKMVLSDQVVEARVVDVLWTPSKDGYLKPRIKIEPVVIGGAKIEYATAFNAAFVEENKIGVGSLIQLVRSGDVIPHIMSVIEPAHDAKMPDVDYVWNDTHVDIMLSNPTEDSTVREKNITRFFVKLGVAGLGPGNVKRIMSAGYDTVGEIINMTVDDFLTVEGFKQRSATKLYTAIQESIKHASIGTLIEASNIFGRGFGEKKVEPLLERIPDVFNNEKYSKIKLYEKIRQIPGFGSKTTGAFLDKYDDFIDFMNKSGLKEKLTAVKKKTVIKDTTHPLYEKTIVFTGFRDKSLQESIEKVGGKVGNTVNKKTFIVLAKDPEDDTGKVNKAKELGIQVVTPTTFGEKYMV